MPQLQSLLIVSALLLVPLIPAAILYLLLTPKDKQGEGWAKGEIDTGAVNVLGMKLQFNVVGSTATYVVLLALATFTYRSIVKETTERESMKDYQAWLVEVPVMLKNALDQPVPANNGELQTVNINLEPAPLEASANTLRFWVVPTNGRFPTARFSITNIGVSADPLDLNNPELVQRKTNERKMTGIAPVWIQIGSAYAAATPAPVAGSSP